MTHKSGLLFKSLVIFFAAFIYATHSLALTINNDIHRVTNINETVTLTGAAELHIKDADPFVNNGMVHLNSPDAWVFFHSILPSQVATNVLKNIRVNGVNAVLNSNVRVVQYAQGAVVIPHSQSFTPLTVFSESNFAGDATALNQYTKYDSSNLGEFTASISSFKLKRGYMATFAQNETGTGVSRVYVAQDGDLNIGVLPKGLNNAIKFVRIFPWRWTTKKGIAGNPSSGLKLQWDYNWNISKNSSLDQEYVAIRQERWWPGLDQDWRARGINHLLGYNEPNSADQSNIAVGDAVWSWPDLLGTGLRVGSPAPTDGGLSWLYDFMNKTAAENKRVDFVVVHYYRCYGNGSDPAGAAKQFYNYLKSIYDTTQKPLWITEWNNGANWTSCADPTAEQQRATVAAILNMLDSTPFVERYALYNWVEDSRRVAWNDGSLTAAGVVYRDQVSPIAYVQAIPPAGVTAAASYKFENNNALDSSANHHHAMQVGARRFVNGIIGDALEFDGENDYLQLPADLGTSTDFTFAAWVYWHGGAIWQRIFDFGNDTNQFLYLTPSSSSNKLRFGIYNGEADSISKCITQPA